MNELISVMVEIKKDLAALAEQLEGAKAITNEKSPTYSYFTHLQRVIFGMHDKLGFQLKIKSSKPYDSNDSAPLNCS